MISDHTVLHKDNSTPKAYHFTEELRRTIMLENGFSRLILQTKEIMTDAVNLYNKLSYYRIDNYPPYDKLEGAICFAKNI